MMEEHHVLFYRMDDLEPLAADIRKNVGSDRVKIAIPVVR
jgi:hypothetical protein